MSPSAFFARVKTIIAKSNERMSVNINARIELMLNSNGREQIHLPIAINKYVDKTNVSLVAKLVLTFSLLIFLKRSNDNRQKTLPTQ